ncbi:hypothetical protein [Gimibacter soli]|uniref:Uncharacterized protein n=1 Tax=Gimibacter soli TaxID=3024400 RepID=A0AAF0BHL1_9PROT|nr:hypothetical protein [Gimibacter soli]WCL54373.1 hypothetical protein PH603_01200 [Gimibacter soli]
MVLAQYRITKYDKSKRDGDGIYWDWWDQWTEAHQIGRVISGRKVRFRDYLRVENKYIEAVLKLFDAAGHAHLRLTNVSLDKWKMQNLRKRNKDLHKSEFFLHPFEEDIVLERDDIPRVMRMILRGIGWGKLELRDKFYVHFADDFYMFVGTDRPDKRIIANIEQSGLYCEDFQTPFFVEPQLLDISRGGPINHDDPDDFLAWDEAFRIRIPLESHAAVKEAFGFSDDHPFVGAWEIEDIVSPQLQAICGHNFDFANFRYWLHTERWG